MAKARRKRTQYSAGQRKQVLAAAIKQKLTAAQVQKQFGVKPVTYYSWRKKTGVAQTRGGRKAHRQGALIVGSPNLANTLRSEVRSRVQRILPEIVRTEVNQYLNGLFAGSGSRRRRSRV